jgi:hypothetical protein
MLSFPFTNLPSASFTFIQLDPTDCLDELAQTETIFLVFLVFIVFPINPRDPR